MEPKLKPPPEAGFSIAELDLSPNENPPDEAAGGTTSDLDAPKENPGITKVVYLHYNTSCNHSSLYYYLLYIDIKLPHCTKTTRGNSCTRFFSIFLIWERQNYTKMTSMYGMQGRNIRLRMTYT